MNIYKSGDGYSDYKDVTLQVVLKSGNTYPEIKCSWFRIFSPPFNTLFENPSVSYDASVPIYYSEINSVRLDHNKVSPENYVSFIDDEGEIWNIVSYEKLNNIPDPPGLAFHLKKQEN
jgi:hypothetical protein